MFKCLFLINKKYLTFLYFSRNASIFFALTFLCLVSENKISAFLDVTEYRIFYRRKIVLSPKVVMLGKLISVAYTLRTY